jgi:copper transport protein
VVLEFSEPVASPAGSVVVLNLVGRVVGQLSRPVEAPTTRVVVAPIALGRGTYVVVWRVGARSAHGRGAYGRGAYVFSVGGPSYSTAPASAPTEASVVARKSPHPTPSPVLGALYWLNRLVVFLAASILLGGLAVVACVWPSGWAENRLRRNVVLSWLVLMIATVLSVPVQGAYALALGPAGALDPSLLGADLRTHFGRVELAQVLLVVVAGFLLDNLGRSACGDRLTLARWWQVAAAGVAVGLLGTMSVAGHGVQGRWIVFGTVVGIVHMGAAALWLGGLFVVYQVVRSTNREESERDQVLERLSEVLVVAVALTVASGVLQSLRQVGSLKGLVTTTYGWLLLAKATLVFVLAGLGVRGRRLVRGRLLGAAPTGPLAHGNRGADDEELGTLRLLGDRRWARLRHLLATEAAVALGVLGVTASLVNTPPASQQLLEPVVERIAVGRLDATIVVAPGRAGPGNQLHVFVAGPDGLPAAAAGLGATIFLPSGNVGPIAVPAFAQGPGHFVAPNFTIPIGGRWRLTLSLWSSETARAVSTTTVLVH